MNFFGLCLGGIKNVSGAIGNFQGKHSPFCHLISDMIENFEKKSNNANQSANAESQPNADGHASTGSSFDNSLASNRRTVSNKNDEHILSRITRIATIIVSGVGAAEQSFKGIARVIYGPELSGRYVANGIRKGIPCFIITKRVGGQNVFMIIVTQHALRRIFILSVFMSFVGLCYVIYSQRKMLDLRDLTISDRTNNNNNDGGNYVD